MEIHGRLKLKSSKS